MRNEAILDPPFSLFPLVQKDFDSEIDLVERVHQAVEIVLGFFR